MSSKKRERQKAVLIRLPHDLVAMVDASAESQYRSRAAEIRLRLEETFAGESIDEHGVIVRQTGPKGK